MWLLTLCGYFFYLSYILLVILIGKYVSFSVGFIFFCIGHVHLIATTLLSTLLCRLTLHKPHKRTFSVLLSPLFTPWTIRSFITDRWKIQFDDIHGLVADDGTLYPLQYVTEQYDQLVQRRLLVLLRSEMSTFSTINKFSIPRISLVRLLEGDYSQVQLMTQAIRYKGYFLVNCTEIEKKTRLSLLDIRRRLFSSASSLFSQTLRDKKEMPRSPNTSFTYSNSTAREYFEFSSSILGKSTEPKYQCDPASIILNDLSTPISSVSNDKHPMLSESQKQSIELIESTSVDAYNLLYLVSRLCFFGLVGEYLRYNGVDSSNTQEHKCENTSEKSVERDILQHHTSPNLDSLESKAESETIFSSVQFAKQFGLSRKACCALACMISDTSVADVVHQVNVLWNSQNAYCKECDKQNDDSDKLESAQYFDCSSIEQKAESILRIHRYRPISEVNSTSLARLIGTTSKQLYSLASRLSGSNIESRDKQSTLLVPHSDLGLVTVATKSTFEGLEIAPFPYPEDDDDVWFSVEEAMGEEDLIVFVGSAMGWMTDHFYRPMLHRVSRAFHEDRMSTVFFLRPSHHSVLFKLSELSAEYKLPTNDASSQTMQTANNTIVENQHSVIQNTDRNRIEESTTISVFEIPISQLPRPYDPLAYREPISAYWFISALRRRRLTVRIKLSWLRALFKILHMWIMLKRPDLESAISP